jgi:hypothetical protein
MVVLCGSNLFLLLVQPAALAAQDPTRPHAVAVTPTAQATPGAKLWTTRYKGPGNGVDLAYAIEVSPDGSEVFVTGSSYGSTSGDDYATLAYDASTGSRLWKARLNGPGNGNDHAYAIVVSPDGSEVFVTGSSYGSRSDDDYLTVAYDAVTGSQLWETRFNGPGNGRDRAYAIQVSPDGSEVFVTGSSYASSSSDDYATVAYDASKGSQLWAKLYDGPGNSYDDAHAIGVSPDGSEVFVTGYSTGSTSSYDYASLAYDASTGSLLWAKRYNGPASSADLATELGVSSDGSEVFVTGYSYTSMGNSTDYATVAYDASTGAKLWAKRYKGLGNDWDFATAIEVSPNGVGVFVTGRSVGSGDTFDYATLAYDASTGAKLWQTRYKGPRNRDDEANALGVSPDGSAVFVTGASIGSSGSDDYATVAYDASTGSQLWTALYDGPAKGDDDAYAIAVSPDGSEVFVTGSSTGSTSDWDYATVAYSVT